MPVAGKTVHVSSAFGAVSIVRLDVSPSFRKKEERSKSGIMPRGSQAANVGEKTRSGKSFSADLFEFKGFRHLREESIK